MMACRPTFHKYSLVFDIDKQDFDLNSTRHLELIKDDNQKASKAMLKDNRLLFTRKKIGKIFDYYSKTFVDIQQELDPNTMEVVDKNLISRVVSKIVLAPHLDKTLINSIINFVVREKPMWSVIDQVVPLIMFCVSEAAKTELNVDALMASVSAALVNSSKEGTIKITPNSLSQAWKMKQLWKYISMNIRSPLNEETNPGMNQDF